MSRREIRSGQRQAALTTAEFDGNKPTTVFGRGALARVDCNVDFQPKMAELLKRKDEGRRSMIHH